MELEEEFIEKHGLNEDQASALTEHFSNQLAEAKKELETEFSGKANENAQGILDGAAKDITKLTGVDRDKGEKFADFIKRSSDQFFEKEKTAISDKQKEIDEKLAEIQKKGGNEHLAKELEQLRSEKDELLKKTADYDELLEKAKKADELGEQLSGFKLQVAFNEIKPQFPKEANEFEVKAKWQAFKDGVLEKNTIEIVDGEPVAIDKENHHKQTKLKDLLAKDETIQELLQGRQQQGSGATTVPTQDVEGIPFKVAANATTAQIRAAIADHLTKEGVDHLGPEWPKKMLEYTNKIKEAQQKA